MLSLVPGSLCPMSSLFLFLEPRPYPAKDAGGTERCQQFVPVITNESEHCRQKWFRRRSNLDLPGKYRIVVLFGAVMGVLWLGVIPLVNGLVVQIFGLRFLSTLTGIAFMSHQAGSFLGAWGGGYLFDLMGSYDLAWKIGVFIGLAAGTLQLLMNDRPTASMQALQAVPA